MAAIPSLQGQRSDDSNFQAPSMEKVIRHAAVIFAGKIKSIQPSTDERNTFVVTFLVTDGIRGVRTGDELQIAEWAGLWTAPKERYRIGQSVILMLHKPDRGGLTSTVGGPLGRLDLSADHLLFSEVQRSALARSRRLAPLLSDDGGRIKKTVPADAFLRSLREAANTSDW
jgi:hypothetical protein